MCSELDSEAVSSTRPTVPEDKHITFEEGIKDNMSESEDDDIGSEELMCNENIDVNDKESDDSDEEELTNRVFPQQKFSPVPFAARRSQTPDIGKIRYSPIAFPTKRAVTPNIYEQMIGKGHSHKLSDTGLTKAGSKMVDFGFREPKGLPHSSKSESMASLSGQFVRPKLPTVKSHSPGLTVSGYFQPTGSVFRPSQPSNSSTTSKFPQISPESGSKIIVGSSADSSFSQPALFPGHSNRLSSGVNISSASSLASNSGLGFQVKSVSSPFKGSGHGGLMVSTNHDVKLAESTTMSQILFQRQKEGTLSNAGTVASRQLTTTASSSNAVPVVSQMTWPTAPMPTSLAPLTVSVSTHTVPRFQPSVKNAHALSPGSKGVQLKPIAPLLSPPLMSTSANGLNNGEMTGARKLLAKKPAPLSGLVVADAKQGFPSRGGAGHFSANQTNVSSFLQSPTKPKQGPSSIPGHLSPKPPLSPRPPVLNTTPLSPKRGNFLGTSQSNTDKIAASAAPPKNASHTGIPSTSKYPMKNEGTPAHLPFNQTVACPVDAQAAQNMASSVNNDSKGQANSKPILKRFIADGMEE